MRINRFDNLHKFNWLEVNGMWGGWIENCECGCVDSGEKSRGGENDDNDQYSKAKEKREKKSSNSKRNKDHSMDYL